MPVAESQSPPPQYAVRMVPISKSAEGISVTQGSRGARRKGVPPTFLLLQDIPAIRVPDAAGRCGFVGGLGYRCLVVNPVGAQPSVREYRGCEERDSDLHPGCDVRVFFEELQGNGSLSGLTALMSNATTNHRRILSMTCSDLIVLDHPFAAVESRRLLPRRVASEHKFGELKRSSLCVQRAFSSVLLGWLPARKQGVHNKFPLR